MKLQIVEYKTKYQPKVIKEVEIDVWVITERHFG